MIAVEEFYKAVLQLFQEFSEINISSTTYSDSSKKILTHLKLKCRANDLRNLKKLYKLWSDAKVNEEVKKRFTAKREAINNNQVDPAGLSTTASDPTHIDMELDEQGEIEELVFVESSNENQIQVHEELLPNAREDKVANLNESVQNLREINENLVKDLAESEQKLQDSVITIRSLEQTNGHLSAELIQIRKKFSEKCIELENTKLNSLQKANERPEGESVELLSLHNQRLPMHTDCLSEEIHVQNPQSNIPQPEDRNVRETEQNVQNEIEVSPCTNQTLTMKKKKPNPNTTFEWVALNGYPSRPCFIHLDTASSIAKEEAQPISTTGDLCQKKYFFTRTETAYKNKPKIFVAALKKFNELYGTNYI